MRRRRIRGYALFSDEEPFSEEYTSDDVDEDSKVPPLVDITDPLTLEDNLDHESSKPYSEILAISTREIYLSDGEWFAASDLPQYTVGVEEVKIQPSLNFAEQIVASFTVYLEMKEAVLDSHYEKVFHRLQQEWTYVGGLVSLFSLPPYPFHPLSIIILSACCPRRVCCQALDPNPNIVLT